MICFLANNNRETKLVKVLILECDNDYFEEVGKFYMDVTTEFEVAPNMNEFKIIALRCAVRCVQNKGYTVYHDIDGGKFMYVSAKEDYIIITTC